MTILRFPVSGHCYLTISLLLLLLPLPGVAQWGESFVADKERLREEKRLEKERMEEREAAARERTDQLRSEGRRELAEIYPYLNEANAWFKSVSELKRRHDAVFGTNSLPGEIVAEALQIRKTLAQCEREVSWLQQEMSGSSRTIKSVVSDIEKNQNVARRVCDDAKAFAKNAFKTSAGILLRSAKELDEKFKGMADRAEFLEWDSDRGLVLCCDAERSGLHSEENALLRVWETMKPYRELDPDRADMYKPDYASHFGSVWGTTGGLFDMLQPFSEIRLKTDSLCADSTDWDPKWKENKLARAAFAKEENERMLARGLININGKWMTPGSVRNCRFTVFQIYEPGHALCHDANGTVFCLLFSARDNRNVAEGDTFTNDLYRCGTYSYITVRGAPNTVRQYAIDLKVAELELKSPNLIF